jgi:hypothetical protein
MALIDDSHAPFKRTKRIGPGPKKRAPVDHTGNLECERRRKTATHYIQVCTYVGDNRARRGKKTVIKTPIKKKKRYMKLYRAWAKNNARIAALQKRGPRRGYKCRKTPVAKCTKKK